MTKFLAIELTENSYGGGSFNGKANFKLDVFSSPFNNVDVKIDTGCSISTVPVKRLKIPEKVCRSLKERDIDDGLVSVRSYGVESGGRFHMEPVTKRQKMKCTALKFQHAVSDMRLEGMDIPIQNIFLNYDRKGAILIGMDIIRLMVSHVDVSRKTGNLLLLCGARQNIDEEFYDAMEEHFGLTRELIVTDSVHS